MTQQDIKRIEELLSVLNGQPMHSFSRAGAMIIANFGNLIKVDVAQRDDRGRPICDENGKRISQTSMKGKYALDALCSMRFTCGNEVIFAKSDIFLPTEELASSSDFVWDTFEWHVHGNNFFDNKVAKHFRGEFQEYIVKNVKVSKFGDMTITFENNFVLEFFADGSGYSENWRFGEINSTEPIVILTGNGIDSCVG